MDLLGALLPLRRVEPGGRGFALTCATCHGSATVGVGGLYWPDGTSYPDRGGAHQNHVQEVSQWLYAENADAAGLLANTGKGTSDVKQKAVCAWCHPNPGVARAGTGEAKHNDNLEPADVHGDGRSGAAASYLQYWTGTAGSGTGTNDAAATFSAATDSCSSTKCHNNNATPSGATNWLTPPAWTTTGCDNTQCHASPRAASGTHLTHYQTKGYACSQCHTVPATLGHADGKVNLSFTGTLSGLTGGAFYDKDASGTSTPGDNAFAAFGTATSTCANVYCHVSKTTPAWNGTIAADACTACHTAGGAGTNPTSGLHTGLLTVSGNPHDDGWKVTKNEVTPTGTCTSCHTATPSTAHVDGTFTPTAPTVTLAATVGFLDGATPTCGPTGALAACHTDGGTWGRRWATTAKNNDGTQCANCHGDFATGWVVGMRVGHDRPGLTSTANHQQCKMCHVYDDAAYGTLGWGGGSRHGDSGITMNTHSTVAYNPTTFGCAAVCHSDDVTHRMADSTWTVDALVGPKASCAVCHGNSATESNWPDGTSYPDRLGAHQRHLDAIAAQRGWTTAAQKNGACDYCHPGNPPAGHPNGGTAPARLLNMDADGNGTADADLGAYRDMAGSAANSTGRYNASTQACANIACHSGVTTPAWYGDPNKPTSTGVVAAPASVQQGTATVTLSATCSDAATGNNAIEAAEYFVGTAGAPGTGTAMVAAGGLFDSPTEAVAATVNSSAWSSGTTNLFVACRDALSNWGPAPAASTALTVTPKDAFTATLSAGPSESLLRGSTDVPMAVVTFTVTAGPSVVLTNLQVTATGSGVPNANVAAVKLYNDNGETPNLWDPGDAVLGASVLNASNVANVDIIDTTVSAGTPLRVLVGYDLTASGTLGNTLGANLTGVTSAPTDNLTTTLPLASGNIKTIAATVPTTYFVDPSTGVSLGGINQTSYGVNCGGGNSSAGSHNTLLTSPEACASSSVWTPTAAATSHFILNRILSSTRYVTVAGAATGSGLRVQNTSAAAVNLSVQFVQIHPTMGLYSTTGASTVTVPASYNGTLAISLSTHSLVIYPGNRFGIRISVPNNAIRLYFGNSQTYLAVTQSPYTPDNVPPVLSVAPAGSPSTIQAGTPSVSLAATCNDASTGASNVIAAEYFVGTEGTAGTGTAMLPQDGAFNSPTEAVTATVNASAWTGNTALYVDCKDASGWWGPATAGTTTITVTPKDTFTVSGTPGPTEVVAQGRVNVTAETLTFSAPYGISLPIQALQVTGTKGAGTGAVAADVSQVRIYNDLGERAGVWDSSDGLLGAGTFNASNVAAIDITDTTVDFHAPVAMHVVYDFAASATVGDVLGANLSGVTYPSTANLTTSLPVSSGNTKTVVAGGSLSCGGCHGIPPTDGVTGRSHAAHASSQAECADCHGTASATYTTAHPDGTVQLGFKTATPSGPTTLTGTNVTYHQGATKIYEDLSGAGGADALAGSDGVDNGTCSGFTTLGVTGCHGSSSPAWGVASSAACGTCHGSTTARTGYAEGAGGWLQGAPPNDRAGSAGSYEVGKHLNHVDVSYGKTGTSCDLCHDGAGKGSVLHGDGTVQVRFRQGFAGGPTATWADSGLNVGPGGTCGGLNAANCHVGATWSPTATIACASCHQTISSHRKVTVGGADQACEACHPGGAYAPTRHSANGKADIQELPLPPASWSDPSGRLNSQNMQNRLGISYKIHLGGDNANSRGASEAEICWKCHDAQTTKVSEWGFNTKTTPAGFPVVQIPTTADGTAQGYDFGWIYGAGYSAKLSDWTLGYWKDAWDDGLIRRISSVHTGSFDSAGQTSSVAVNVTGSGTVKQGSGGNPNGDTTGNPTLEDKGFIRCSFCHDVHDLNRSLEEKPAFEGGNNRPVSGKPWLRGTWTGNPYPPDLPPRAPYVFYREGPRVGPGGQGRGGYFIDQNSGNPTDNAAMDTVSETAGLCTLCHGTDVDGMDFYPGSKLWRTDTVNGHSNSTLGGTGVNQRNLFDANRGGDGGCGSESMTNQDCIGSQWGDGNAPFYSAYSAEFCRCPVGYTGWWDNWEWYTTGGIGGRPGDSAGKAHAFTCSKCHTPHASGLPALLSTNCLDATLLNNPQALWNESTNCHRKTGTADGWHRLAPKQ